MNEDFKARLTSARGLIWDLDNTLYRLNEQLFTAFNIAVARAVLEAGVDLDMERATAMAHQSFIDHGFSGRVFVNDYGVDNVWLHDKYHDLLDEAMIDRNLQVVELFASMPEVEHAIITHGSGKWALRVLERLGLGEWFRQERVLAFENYDYQRKSDSTLSFERALERMELEAKDVIMLEDTPHNLPIPHKMGMATVLFHYGSPYEKPPYISACYHDALEFLHDLKRAKADMGREFPKTAP